MEWYNKVCIVIVFVDFFFTDLLFQETVEKYSDVEKTLSPAGREEQGCFRYSNDNIPEEWNSSIMARRLDVDECFK